MIIPYCGLPNKQAATVTTCTIYERESCSDWVGFRHGSMRHASGEACRCQPMAAMTDDSMASYQLGMVSTQGVHVEANLNHDEEVFGDVLINPRDPTSV